MPGKFDPPLTSRHIEILRLSPYEQPTYWGNRNLQTKDLSEKGLLEEDPQTPGMFRITEAGTNTLHAWKKAGF